MRTEFVTTLKRQATELSSDIERYNEPILIIQHGLGFYPVSTDGWVKSLKA